MERDDRVLYYAAGVLWWAIDGGNWHFTSDEPRDWREHDPDNDPLGLDGHYLSDKKLLDMAFDYLVEEQVLTRVQDRYGPETYSVDDRTALNSLAERYPWTPFQHTERFGERWITKALQKIALESPATTEEADYWEPLRIDVADPDAKEALHGIEEAIRAIAADNGFSATHPGVRDRIVEDANNAVSSIKAGTATRGQVRQSLVAAGRWIAEKFAGTGIGTVAGELVKWGLRLLGFPV